MWYEELRYTLPVVLLSVIILIFLLLLLYCYIATICQRRRYRNKKAKHRRIVQKSTDINNKKETMRMLNIEDSNAYLEPKQLDMSSNYNYYDQIIPNQVENSDAYETPIYNTEPKITNNPAQANSSQSHYDVPEIIVIDNINIAIQDNTETKSVAVSEYSVVDGITPSNECSEVNKLVRNHHSVSEPSIKTSDINIKRRPPTVEKTSFAPPSKEKSRCSRQPSKKLSMDLDHLFNFLGDGVSSSSDVSSEIQAEYDKDTEEEFSSQEEPDTYQTGHTVVQNENSIIELDNTNNTTNINSEPTNKFEKLNRIRDSKEIAPNDNYVTLISEEKHRNINNKELKISNHENIVI